MSPHGWLWVLACAGVTVAANVLLRLAVDRSHVTLFASGVARLGSDIVRLLAEPCFIPAVGLYGFAMMIWLRVLKTEPLSVAYPVLASLTFVAVALAGILVFGEPVKMTRIAGLVFILIGLSLMFI